MKLFLYLFSNVVIMKKGINNILIMTACLLFFCLKSFGQDQKYIDSLKVASHSPVDSVRFNAYSFLSWNLKEQDKASALKYANLLLKEATAKNNQKWIARSLSDFSVIYQYTGDTKKAMEYAEKAIVAAKRSGVKKDIAGTLLNLSGMKSRSGELAEALQLELSALKIYEELKKKYYIAVTCNAIGMSYNNIGNFRQSNSYLNRALTISKERKDLYLESITLGGMADNYKSLNMTDSSMILYKEAKQLFKEMENFYNYAVACNNLGQLYFQVGNIKASKSEYMEAIKTGRQMQDTGSVSEFEANLAEVFIKEGKYDEAESLLLNSQAVAQKFGNKSVEINIIESLIGLYTHKKNVEKTELYFKKYNEMRDSVFSKSMGMRFSEAQTKFDVEKKDLEILKNKAELQRSQEERARKNLMLVLILTLFVGTVLSAFLFYRKKQVQQRALLDAEMALQKEIRAKSIIEAEERQRRRIAQDLHDGIGQILSAAKLNLSSLEATINPVNDAQKFALKNTLDLIDDSVKEVRAVSHNMMPNTLIKLGLASAVREFITKLGNLPNLKIDLEIIGLDKRLDENAETALYRAIQEIVSNIIKHAGANKISIQLIRHDKELSVVIEDNGVGFDTSRINEFEGIGLKNILSRVEFINGTVHFDSIPGKGTTVLIDVPVV